MPEKVDSVATYKTRKVLKELSSKKGRGTELVSLYVPPKKALHEVINGLREEYGTASNIKSDTTRNHVQDALTRTMARLKLFKKTPDNGIVLFVGALPTNGPGSEQVFVNEIVPPKPVQTFLYRCDDHFHLEHLIDMLKVSDIIGILSIDATEAGYGILAGDKFDVEEVITSGVSGKTRAGGQSAKRYQRLREMELSGYYSRAAHHAKKIFLEETIVKGLIISGPGPTKDYFLKSDYLDYRLKDRILAVLDGAYSGSEGVRETLEKSRDLLSNVRVVEERKLVQRFLQEINREKGLAIYGVSQIIEALKLASVDVVIASDDLNMLEIKVKCKRCGEEKSKIIKRENYVSEKQGLISAPCSSCGSQDYAAEERDLIDILDDLAIDAGAKMEVVSGRNEEGRMLKSFGSLGALLRYRI